MKIRDFLTTKKNKNKLVMVTAYDAPTAEILENAGVDMVLVGDSLGMVVLGYPSTTFVTMDEMIHHAKAVRRGAKKTFLVGDLPLKGVKGGPRQALLSAKRFMNEAGCDAVKIEWGIHTLKSVELLRKHNIPVMGHIGLTPQTVKNKEGFRVQGQNAADALKITLAAKDLEEEGVFSLLLECVPSPVAAAITKQVKVSTIGIGAGRDCDGQVLVFHDLVGMFQKFKPRFVKRYAEAAALMASAVSKFSSDVRNKKFPDDAHSFGMNIEELSKFNQVFLKEKKPRV